MNTKIAEECPDDYTFNPDNEYIKIRHKELWKGSYTVSGAREEGYIVESGGQQSSSGSFHTEGVSGSKTSIKGQQSYNAERSSMGSFSSKEEAVQLYPQEVNLKLRISKFSNHA